LATRSWTLYLDQLIEHETDVTGTLSLAVLEGPEWILTLLPQNQMMQEGAAVTMTVSDGQVSGTSGYNRYSAGIEYGPPPGEVSVGSAMGTRMACPEELMKLESEFLGLLSAVSTFRFLAGKLVLSGDSEGDYFTLTFEPE
jgi:heat shock protein HslJ